MKGVEFDSELGEEFKGNVDATFCQIHASQVLFPFTQEGGFSKWIRPPTTHKGMPKTNAEAKPLLHGFAHQHLIWVVVSKAQRIRR